MNDGVMFDVVVAGAGPAGSSCAAVLAKQGLRVILVDRAEFPREKICGCCINPACWPLFRSLGVGEDIMKSSAAQISSVRVVSGKGDSVHAQMPGRLPGPFIAISRGTLDDMLLQNARNRGAEFLPSAQLLEMQSDESIRVSMQTPGGRVDVGCRYLVGADGRNSVVASWINPKPPASSPRRVAFQWYTPFQSAVKTELVLAILPFGYVGVVNLDAARANVAMVFDAGLSGTSPRAIPLRLSDYILSSPVLADIVHDLSPLSPIHSAYPVNPRRNVSRDRRIFLAGDARCTTEPFTGEGVMFALSDGMRTGCMILSAEGKHCADTSIDRSRFLSNQILSRLLRRPKLRNFVLSGMTHLPRSFPLALRRVI